MLSHLFNRQHRPTHHSTVTALQGCLRYPQYRSLSLQSCPDHSHDVLLFLSFLTTFQYMMAGIHLDMQLCDKVCIFLKEVWQVRSARNILDCLILLLLLARKYLKSFAPVEEADIAMKNRLPSISHIIFDPQSPNLVLLRNLVRSFQKCKNNCAN